MARCHVRLQAVSEVSCSALVLAAELECVQMARGAEKRLQTCSWVTVVL